MNTPSPFTDSYWIWSYWILHLPLGSGFCPSHQDESQPVLQPTRAPEPLCGGLCRHYALASDPRYMLHWQGTLELADLPLQKGSVELLKQRWESPNMTRPSLMFQHSPLPPSLVPDRIALEKMSSDSRRADVFKEETLGGSQPMEHVPVTVEELRSHFEALGGKKVSACVGWRSRGMNGEGPQSSSPSLTLPLCCALLGMGNTGLNSHGCPVDCLH